MFDVDNFTLQEVINASPDYKLVRYGGWLWLFPSSTDFSGFDFKTEERLINLERSAVLAISPDGNVTKNRFRKTAI